MGFLQRLLGLKRPVFPRGGRRAPPSPERNTTRMKTSH